MLKKSHNEMLTRVGPDTPMGDYMRRYWQPGLLAREIPDPDCAPVRVRLLGEDLVAFRDTEGRIGVIDAFCSHRGAPLYYGRNEKCGLRCVYHGWKYDIEGNCIDRPNVPGGTRLKKLKIKSYPVREVNHVIWIYMGPPELEPPLPEFEWMQLPADHVFAHKRVQECNYLQILEGEMDSSHVSFLHSRWDDFYGEITKTHPMFTDTAPRFDIVDTVYGQMVAAQRDAGKDEYFYRVTHFVLPCHVLVHIVPDSFMDFSGSVPMDDENTLGFTVAWRPDRPLDEKDMEAINGGELAYPVVDPKSFLPLRNSGNDYMIDRELQRTISFTGITGVREQDSAVQEGQGKIFDRSKENLCASDEAIVRLRRLLLKEVNNLVDGVQPAAPQRPDSFCLRGAHATIPREGSWIEATKKEVLGIGAEEIVGL